MTQPSGVKNILRAAAGALPFIPRGDTVPDKVLKIDELAIDSAHVADYAAVTGLRYKDTVPLTYPFALTFPTVMSLVTGFDFPFAAMGAVHTENHITQYKPIAVTDTVGVTVHAENLREHRKGLLVDVVTEVNVGITPRGIRSPPFCISSAPASPMNPNRRRRSSRNYRRRALCLRSVPARSVATLQ
jgi:hypothetical protein